MASVLAWKTYREREEETGFNHTTLMAGGIFCLPLDRKDFLRIQQLRMDTDRLDQEDKGYILISQNTKIVFSSNI